MAALEQFVVSHPDLAEKSYGEAVAMSLSQACPCQTQYAHYQEPGALGVNGAEYGVAGGESLLVAKIHGLCEKTGERAAAATIGISRTALR